MYSQQVEQTVGQLVHRWDQPPRIFVLGQNVDLGALQMVKRRSHQEAEEFLAKVKPMDKIYGIENGANDAIYGGELSVVAVSNDKLTVHEVETNTIFHLKTEDIKKCFNFVDLAITTGWCGFFTSAEDLMEILNKFAKEENDQEQEAA